MQLYAAESVLLRVQKMKSLKGEDQFKVYQDILDVFVFDSAALIRKNSLDAACSFAFGEVRDLLEKGIDRFTKVAPVNVKESRRRSGLFAHSSSAIMVLRTEPRTPIIRSGP